MTLERAPEGSPVGGFIVRGDWGEVRAPRVILATGGKALPLYRAPHYKFEAHVVYTNLPVAGAFRGYGGPQGFFPVERHMDRMAAALDEALTWNGCAFGGRHLQISKGKAAPGNASRYSVGPVGI